MASHVVASNRIRMEPMRTPNPIESTAAETEPAIDRSLANDVQKWIRKFESMARENAEQEQLDATFAEFSDFLYTATSRLPGPQHPSVAYYKKRRAKKLAGRPAGQSKSSNPQRSDAKAKQRSRDEFKFKEAQFEFKFNRKRLARRVMSDKPQLQCPIPMAELERHFQEVFGSPNDRVLPEYPSSEPKEQIEVTLDDTEAAIKAIALDTSPGEDRIPIRTVRDLRIAPAIKALAEIMLATGMVPKKLAVGKTVLIHKGGDPNDCQLSAGSSSAF